MTPDRWIALLGVAVALLGVCVPVLVSIMLRRNDRQRAERAQLQAAHDAEKLRMQAVIEKQNETIERQREAIIDFKIAQREFSPAVETMRRLLASLPVPPDGDGT